MDNHNEIVKKVESISRRYRSDSDFRAEVDADPAAALRNEGCADLVPEGASVSLHLNDAKTMHIVFPSAVKSQSDEDLSTVVGGWRWGGYQEYDMDKYRNRRGPHDPIPMGGPKIGGVGSCMG